MGYAVFRSDNMSGTDVAADLVSVKYYGSDDKPAEIENGCVVKLEGLLPEEREIYKAVAPDTNTPVERLAVVGSPELLYDERQKNLSDFINKADLAARGYLLKTGNVFSVTKEALSGTPKAGDVVELDGSTKLKAVTAASGPATKVGTIIEVEQTVRYTYYVIRIGM